MVRGKPRILVCSVVYAVAGIEMRCRGQRKEVQRTLNDRRAQARDRGKYDWCDRKQYRSVGAKVASTEGRLEYPMLDIPVA